MQVRDHHLRFPVLKQNGSLLGYMLREGKDQPVKVLAGGGLRDIQVGDMVATVRGFKYIVAEVATDYIKVRDATKSEKETGSPTEASILMPDQKLG